MNCLDLSTISNEWIRLIYKIPQNIRNRIDDAIILEEQKYLDSLQILPKKELRLECMRYFQPLETRVVIIGQDPYINPEQPMGMSFSVPKGVSVPPSLKNMYKELETDILGFKSPNHGDLTPWAKQGVLLLNVSLTVVERLSNSHKIIWRDFIPKFLEIFSEEHPNIVYLLWGNDAKAMKKYIRHGIFIEGAHPSPLARGAFFGGRYFSRTNEELLKMKKEPIDWSL